MEPEDTLEYKLCHGIADLGGVNNTRVILTHPLTLRALTVELIGEEGLKKTMYKEDNRYGGIEIYSCLSIPLNEFKVY